MRLYKLLSSKERIKILSAILYNQNEFVITDVANGVNVNKGLVSRFFNLLVKEDILKRDRNNFLVRDNLNVKALKILLNLNRIDWKIFKEFDFVRGAGLYGSFVKGENTEDSDIDLYVLVEDTEEENLAELTRKLDKLSKSINPIYLTNEKVRQLKKEDELFYHSLAFSSINVCGDYEW